MYFTLLYYLPSTLLLFNSLRLAGFKFKSSQYSLHFLPSAVLTDSNLEIEKYTLRIEKLTHINLARGREVLHFVLYEKGNIIMAENGGK